MLLNGHPTGGFPFNAVNHLMDIEIFFFLAPDRLLTSGTNKEQCSSYVLIPLETCMLKIFVEEAAALASISLFVGMIAVWAELIIQL